MDEQQTNPNQVVAQRRTSPLLWLTVMLAFAGAIAASAWLAWSFGFKAGQVAQQAAHAEYVCPWHPTVVSDKPGQCPADGMFLMRRQPGQTGVAKAAPAPAAKKGPAAQTMMAYADLYEALVAGQAEGAAAAATALAQAGADVPPMTKALQDFPKDLPSQRQRFVAVSEALIAHAKKNPNDFNGIHVMSCDMYKGRWLQKAGPLRNPYYGDEMLSCGEDLGAASRAGQP